MSARFDQDGISFQYPENWELEREETDGGWVVSVQSKATAFLTLTLDYAMPPAGALTDTALAALREDYPDLEAEPVAETIAGLPAVGYDVRFFSFDLTNTCRIRGFHCGRGSVLLMSQANDTEEINERVLSAIC